MKVVAFRSTKCDKVYGEKYTQEFFKNMWKENLESCPKIDEVVYYDTPIPTDKFAEAVGDADAVVGYFIHDNVVCEELFEKCPNLKYISTGAHGFGKFDLEATKRHNVVMTNTIYGDVTIAQFAMGLLLDICHNVELHSQYYRTEKWTTPDTPENPRQRQALKTPQYELFEKTIGIYGLGNIGFKVAQMAQGFGMNVIAYSRNKKEGSKYDFIKQVSFEELIEQSDVISVHCPLTEDTKNSIDAKVIANMKDGVILINTARGAIIDEEALYDALKSKKIYAAGLDVVADEPLQAPCKLMECDNAKITEHIAWLPMESRIRSNKIMCDNFISYLNGEPKSVINK